MIRNRRKGLIDRGDKCRGGTSNEKVKGMAGVMGSEWYMLCETEGVKKVKEVGDIRCRGIVNVKVKVAGNDEIRGG